MRRVHVLALGNPLMGDDGLAIRVLARLKRIPWPKGILFRDLSGGGFDCLDTLLCDSPVLLLDAIEAGLPAGTVVRFCASRIGVSLTDTFSLHEMHFLHLACSHFPERLSDITVLAMQPGRLRESLSLSAAVAGALPLMAKLAEAEISRLSRCAGEVPPPRRRAGAALHKE